ncbi:MAG TPA: choice-of-anchor D domain-containing protein, partial [Candidatus Obscuribacterales bacterium]
MDQVLIDLDNHGLSNGNLEIRDQKTGQSITFNSLIAYNNLVAKGWTIDVPAPAAPNTQVITLTTTSTNSSWSPATVTNSAALLKWAVSGGVSIPEVVINDPTFDLNGNTGTATITVTSDDGFSGLTALDFWVEPDGGFITNIDLSNATALTSLNMRYNRLTSLDVSQNTALTSLIIRGGLSQIPDQALNTSTNTQLNQLWIDDTGINSVDLSNNSLLTDVRLYLARLTTAVLDQVLIDLDNHGLSNGNLEIRDQKTGQSITFNSLIAYNRLIAKGWVIDVPAPAGAPGPEINVTLGGTSIATGNVPVIADGSDFGQVVIGAPVTKTIRVENLGDSPLTVNGFFANSSGGFIFVPPFSFSPTVLAPGGFFTVSVTFNPSAIGVQTGSLTISNSDTSGNENPYVINLRAEGVTVITNPSIVVLGNGLEIANGDVSPDITDNTNFGQVENNLTKTNQFTIENDGTDDLEVTGIDFTFGADAEFSIVAPAFPQVIVPGG